MSEIKRPGGEWQDDDGAELPVGTLTRAKFSPRAPGERGTFRRAVLRVAGVSAPDDEGAVSLKYETVSVETISYGV